MAEGMSPHAAAGAVVERRGKKQGTRRNQLLDELRRNTAAQTRLAQAIETQAQAIHALADAISHAASDAPDIEEDETDEHVPRYMDGTSMPRGSTG